MNHYLIPYKILDTLRICSLSIDKTLEWLTDAISQHPHLLYLVVGLFSCAESLFIVGLFLPGALTLFTLMAVAGAMQLPLTWLLIAATTGAILGDNLGYLIGGELRDKFLHKPMFQRYQPLLRKSNQLFKTYGIFSIFIGRFIGPLRPFIPTVAGMARMNFTKFMIANCTSAVLWSASILLPGYYLGESDFIKTYFTPKTIMIVLAVYLVLFGLYQMRASIKQLLTKYRP